MNILDLQRISTCSNRCVFCFIDQLPDGLRPSLYVRDEDWRMSSIFGNFITMTNITREELDYIIDMHVTPLYVSLHASQTEIREKMLGISRGSAVSMSSAASTDSATSTGAANMPGSAVPVMDMLAMLERAGCELHLQVVVCPGYNDGIILAETVEDCWQLGSGVHSLGIVPVGLTMHRDNLPPINPVNCDMAGEILAQLEKWQIKARRERGTGWIYGADELYLLANREFPDVDSYDSFPQLENGIGISRLMLDEFSEIMRYLKERDIRLERQCVDINPKAERYVILCGESAAAVLEKPLADLCSLTGIYIEIMPVKNALFGPSVTVTGLLAGKDVLHALQKVGDGTAFLSDVCLDGEQRFLDDMTVQDIEKSWQGDLHILSSVGDLFSALGFDMREYFEGKNSDCEADWEYCLPGHEIISR